MIQLQRGPLVANCRGISRRSAIKAGFSGVLGLSLADLFRLRAEGGARRNSKSVILLWLDGGPSHLETYDPKPEAPSDYRGPWGAIETNVPGIRLSEMVPEQAKLADKLVFVRSLHHNTGDHFAAAHWMLTGRFGSTDADKPQKFPSVGSYVSRIQGPKSAGMPAYVGLPSAESVYLFPGYQGAAYLGPAYNPFDANIEQRYLGAGHGPAIQSPRWLAELSADTQRLQSRVELLHDLDQLRRDVDASRTMETLDRYQQQAVDFVLNTRARDAFDLEKESAKTQDRYGRGPWGHYALMARRLVEAGVSFVTVDMPHWDDHANIKDGHGAKVPVMDRAAAALISDLSDRGLLQDTLVLVMGEFGRTPKINQGLPGNTIPGRDHWGDAFSVMMAGGGLRGGQVVGSTNSKGEFPVERPLTPADILATVYHVMGIDPRQTFLDHTGRPVPLLDQGEPIREIV
ncbi:MAG: DUF1501 domain-containing protein [Verrucomicrobiales bacterium]|nr:DUF1501 domain-containing protein [Verrucomicrobiales bacterium]